MGAGLRALQPASCRNSDFLHEVEQLAPEIIVVVAYGQILPPELLKIPRIAINVHFSLLPQLRGAAPVQRAVQWGFGKTGVTVQEMAAELDAGPIMAQRRIPIHRTDDAATVRRRLVAVGTGCLRKVLERLAGGEAEKIAQEEGLSTFAAKIERAEQAIDFRWPASIVARQIKGLADSGGAYCFIDGKRLKLWTARDIWRSEPGGSPGMVEAAIEAGALVNCGGHYLVVTEAQLEGKKRMSGPELVRGRILGPGKRLDAAASGSGQTPGG